MKLLSVLLLVFPLTLFAQTRDELIKQFMEERKQMMQQMMKIFQDDFSDDSFFDDSFDMSGSLGAGKKFQTQGENVELKENYNDDGSIDILILPKNKNMTLNINTKNNTISIDAEMKVEEKTEKEGQVYTTYSTSKFSRQIGVPQGYNVKEPEAIDQGYKISLIPTGDAKKYIINPSKSKPESTQKAAESKDLKPIKQAPGEEAI